MPAFSCTDITTLARLFTSQGNSCRRQPLLKSVPGTVFMFMRVELLAMWLAGQGGGGYHHWLEIHVAMPGQAGILRQAEESLGRCQPMRVGVSLLAYNSHGNACQSMVKHYRGVESIDGATLPRVNIITGLRFAWFYQPINGDISDQENQEMMG